MPKWPQTLLAGGEVISHSPHLEVVADYGCYKIKRRNKIGDEIRKFVVIDQLHETSCILSIYNSGKQLFAAEGRGKFHWLTYRQFQNLVSFGEVALRHCGHNGPMIQRVGHCSDGIGREIVGKEALIGIEIGGAVLYIPIQPRYFYRVWRTVEGAILVTKNRFAKFIPFRKLSERNTLPVSVSA